MKRRIVDRGKEVKKDTTIQLLNYGKVNIFLYQENLTGKLQILCFSQYKI